MIISNNDDYDDDDNNFNFPQSLDDGSLPVVARHLGRLCHGLTPNLNNKQKTWFIGQSRQQHRKPGGSLVSQAIKWELSAFRSEATLLQITVSVRSSLKLAH